MASFLVKCWITNKSALLKLTVQGFLRPRCNLCFVQCHPFYRWHCKNPVSCIPTNNHYADIFHFSHFGRYGYSLSCSGAYICMPALILTAHRCKCTVYFKTYTNVHSPGKIQKLLGQSIPVSYQSYQQKCSFMANSDVSSDIRNISCLI